MTYGHKQGAASFSFVGLSGRIGDKTVFALLAAALAASLKSSAPEPVAKTDAKPAAPAESTAPAADLPETRPAPSVSEAKVAPAVTPAAVGVVSSPVSFSEGARLSGALARRISSSVAGAGTGNRPCAARTQPEPSGRPDA